MSSPTEPPISLEPLESATVVVVRGELDVVSHEAIASALDAALARDAPVLVDLTPCTFMDSTGTNALVRAGRIVRETGRPLVVACPPDGEPGKLLNIIAREAIEVHPDRDSALRALAEHTA